MCQQALNQHLCTHTSPGPVTTCGTPSSPGHHITQTATTIPALCPSCTRGDIPAPNTDLQRSIVSAPPPPYTSFAPPSTVYFPSPPPLAFIQHLQQPQPQIALQPSQHTPNLFLLPTFSTPPPFPPYPPGQVPSWVPRETRYELIRDVLTPVEHFQGPPAQLGIGRGYNPFHGFDSGPLQLGLGGMPLVHFSEMVGMVNPGFPTTWDGEIRGAVGGGGQEAEGVRENEGEEGETAASSSAAVSATSSATVTVLEDDSATSTSIPESLSDLSESRSDDREPTRNSPVRSKEDSAGAGEAASH